MNEGANSGVTRGSAICRSFVSVALWVIDMTRRTDSFHTKHQALTAGHELRQTPANRMRTIHRPIEDSYRIERLVH